MYTRNYLLSLTLTLLTLHAPHGAFVPLVNSQLISNNSWILTEMNIF